MNLEYTRNKKFPVIEKTNNPRKAKAKTMLKMGLVPKDRGKGVYMVPSQTDPKRGHIVMNKRGRWFCSCMDRIKRRVICKHIFLFQLWLEKEQSKLQEIASEATDKKIILCEYCGSTKVVRYGTRPTKNGDKQRHKCKNCKGT